MHKLAVIIDDALPTHSDDALPTHSDDALPTCLAHELWNAHTIGITNKQV